MSVTKQYDHKDIEEKWLKLWNEQQLFQNIPQELDQIDPASKMFLLFAFAYPSGSGLHVGHVESKTALDILARYYRMNGKQVYFPVGWDAFGLPAENYAIKTGIPPATTTKEAIKTFRRQIKRLGISYDWQNEIATSHPGYYRWTQWLFLQLYEKDLAYQASGIVNWCPSCQTVLANEQVVEGLCERCGAEVEQKEMKQWYFKITEYKDELLSGLEEVDWPEATKQHQRNWIGKKEGINIRYEIEGRSETIECFTTRPDTNFGATFIVLAPEHQLAQQVASEEGHQEVKQYIDQALRKTELERQQAGHKKTGVFTSYHAINNLNGKKMPIWVSDFVLAGFGTGAVIGVPGHDRRDFEFAQVFDLDVIRVVVAADGDDSPIERIEQVQEEEGTMVNSEFLDGMDIHQATEKIMDYLEEKGWAKRKTSYKLRDWLISRQRYWGAPIPIIYDPDGQPHVVKLEKLEGKYQAWKLPTDVDFKPTGESPLTSSQEFIKRTEEHAGQHFADLIKEKGWSTSGKGWRPEFDTMDTFVDSSWYFMRYCDTRNEKQFANQDRLKQWLPVDLYLIGPEHIVLHLLYSRFLTKFLHDRGFLDFGEPFTKMRHQGMILGPDNKKMSKSKGNVISPDKVIEQYGADTLRVYEMFMGPFEADKSWETRSVAGVHRFLRRVQDLVENKWLFLQSITADSVDSQAARKLKTKLHQTIKKVTEDIPKLKFNTAIAVMMEFTHELERNIGGTPGGDFSREDMLAFIRLLAPFAPFLAEDLWHKVYGGSDNSGDLKDYQRQRDSIHLQTWPVYDPQLAQDSTVVIAIQVNGKLRGELVVSREELEGDPQQVKTRIITQAQEVEKVKKWLADHQQKRDPIYVPGKIVNFVI